MQSVSFAESNANNIVIVQSLKEKNIKLILDSLVTNKGLGPSIETRMLESI